MTKREKQVSALSLYPGARLCVRCGFCCRQANCGFGEWNHREKRCWYLAGKKDGTYECGIYEQIVGSSQQEWKVSPAFGAGCCSPFNGDRRAILSRRRV